MTYDNKLDWKNLTADRIEKMTQALMDESKKATDAFVAAEGNLLNAFYDYVRTEQRAEPQQAMVTFPKETSPDAGIREAATKATSALEAYSIELGMREDLYLQIKKVKEAHYDKVDALDQRLMDRYLRDFERHGIALPQEKRDKVKALKKKLSDVTIRFQKTLGEDKTFCTFDDKDLEGADPKWIANLSVDEETNQRKVTLQYPDLLPAMNFVKSDKVRQVLGKAKAFQCKDKNVPLFEEALQLRRDIAKEMGYQTWAHYQLETRMAKNPEKVKTFLFDLKDKLQVGGKAELDELKALKKEATGDDTFNTWDYRYYAEKRKQSKYTVDSQQVKAYFPTDHVVKETMAIYQEIFGLRFEEHDDPNVWEESVRHFSVFDSQSDDFVGQFYLDLYPRDNKYGHAAMFPLTPSYVDEHGKPESYGVAAMVCNMPKPTKDNPSTLSHSDLVTFFHEFGHVCHGIMAKSRYGRFSGTRGVEVDAIEQPSQMFENWCWKKESLQRLSKHVDTGKPLPDSLIDKMVAAKNCGSALFYLRQLFFGIIDITVHTSQEKVNTTELWNKLKPEITMVGHYPGENGFGAFGHMMSSYTASYYGYLWALALASDVFTIFDKKGLFNQTLGRHYRDNVLAVGSQRDSADLIRDFLEREPNNEAFFKELGLNEE